MRNKPGSLLMTLGVLLLAAAIGLTCYNIWDENRAQGSVTEILAKIEPIPPTPAPETATPLYVLHPEMEMPTYQIDGNRYIGVLSIPALELELPILDAWSDANAKLAPCRYRGSVYSEDLIIAGHNYRNHFGPLKNLDIGAEVRFTDADGNEFSYSVAEMEVLDGSAVEEMQAGDWALTLFTCTYGGQERLTLRCV